MDRYGIRKASQMINLDETSISFRANGRRIKRNALGKKHKLYKTIVRSWNSYHITVMSVATAACHTFKTVVVYPGV